jgi:hypothetical protein
MCRFTSATKVAGKNPEKTTSIAGIAEVMIQLEIFNTLLAQGI